MSSPAPGMINAMADAIVTRLAARTDFAKWKVATYPENATRYPFTTPKELLVSYEESVDVEGAFPGITDRTMSWGVTIVARGLLGYEGMHFAIGAVREALQGWQLPQGGTAMVPSGDKFISEEEGLFRWVVLFKMTLPSVSVPDQGDAAPPYQPSTNFSDDIQGGIDPTLNG